MKTSTLMLTALMITINASGAAQPAGQPLVPTSGAEARSIPSSTLTDCDYNACALRLKLSWGNWLIIRGEQEQRVAKLGIFRAPSVESIVASSPDAVAEARMFRNNYTPGEVLQAVGVVMMVTGLASAAGNHSAVIPITGVLGGGAVLLYGASRSVRALNALNKTIWLYNRSLKR
jgi:hypothetical protein